MVNELNKNNAEYIGYEYREITVLRKHASLCLDSYPCFGWEADPNRETRIEDRNGQLSKSVPKTGDTATLYFRRNRSICNKAELTRLQRHFDSCIAELKELDRSKTTGAIIAALVVGMLGTAFMAGSTFAAVSEPPIIWLMVLLAIPGFLGWIVPYFLYRAIVRKRTKAVEPLIEQKYDEINTICEKGTHLLH